MRVCLTIPERFAAQKELPLLLTQPAGLYVFPEGFLRSQEDLELALELTKDIPATVVTGYREGDWEKALVLEGGRVVDEYAKCILTKTEREKGKRPGDRLRCLNSRLGKLAVPICYELHFPEVCRVMALEEPVMLINPIGTGMYHSRQYSQWRALAQARAIENQLPVAGCCHYCGEIPLAFAFSCHGESLVQVKGAHGAFLVEMELPRYRPIDYFADRRPELFAPLAASGEI